MLDASLVKQTNLETLITALDAVQDNALTKLGEIETTNNANQVLLTSVAGLITTSNNGLSSIDSGISDLDTLLTDIEGGVLTDNKNLLTTIDSDTDNIKTATELIATAVDTNSSNATAVRSDVYFEGVASETNSGNKNANCQRIVIATDDVPIALVNTKLDHLSDNLDTLETTADAILAKNTEIETTADAILAKNTEMETSLNSLISANHTDLVALEATLTEIAPRQATAGVYSNASLADDGVSSVIDTDDYKYMTICASQGSADLPLEIQYSINNSNWFKVRSKLLEFASYEGGSWADIVLEHPMRYVRFVNTSGATMTTLYLSYQLSN